VLFTVNVAADAAAEGMRAISAARTAVRHAARPDDTTICTGFSFCGGVSRVATTRTVSMTISILRFVFTEVPLLDLN